MDDDRPPSTIASKTALSNIGLGPGSIVCDINAPSVHEYLITRYPPLSQAGGYELLLYQRELNNFFDKQIETFELTRQCLKDDLQKSVNAQKKILDAQMDSF